MQNVNVGTFVLGILSFLHASFSFNRHLTVFVMCYILATYLPTAQGLTIDSRVSEAAPPRMIKGQLVPDIKAYYDNLKLQKH
jgi:hypothetical protein